jgi:hypothetical protein
VKTKVFIFIFAFFTNLNSALAAEYFNYNESIRSLGMGGVSLPFNEPSEVLFNNPAGLAFVEGVNFQLLGLRIGANGLDLYNNFANANLSDASSLSSLTGKPIWINALGSLALTIPYFGLGAYKNYTFSAVLNNPAYPNLEASLLDDSAYVLGFAIPVGPLISWGMNFKRMTRLGGSKTIGLGTVIDATSTNNMTGITDQFTSTGTGYGFDTSVMMRIPSFINPTIVLSWKDIGTTTFQNTSDAGIDGPDRIADNLSLGVGTKIDLPGIDLSTGAEYRHIRESGQLGKKLHLGTELSIPFIDLRAGLGQGYVSYGLGMNLLLMRMDLAYYTVEMGEYPGQTPQNRIQLGLNIEFGFDANFKLTDEAGKKRKLKQRR